MAARSISETQRVRYLLGLSSPAEREHIESAYFEDDAAFQEMLAAEDDLIDAYARGELIGDERQRFEKSSLQESDRVQFARAFSGTVSVTGPVETGTWLDILQSPRLLRTATIAAMIVFVAVLAWLVIDRRRMTNELSELRAESTERSKRAEALQRSSDDEQSRTAPFPQRAQADKPKPRERKRIATQRARPLSAEKLLHTENRPLANAFGLRKIIPGNKPERTEKLINTEDAILGNNFEFKMITELPLNIRDVPSLLSLQPGGYVAGTRIDQTVVTLDGVDIKEPLNTFFLKPQNTSSSDETTILIPDSLSWIRFQIALETAAIHDDYRVLIKTTDGRSVTSVDWLEPLTPNQTVIETPAIATVDLPSGDYVLLLMGKESDGSFVKVAEYSFKVTKY